MSDVNAYALLESALSLSRDERAWIAFALIASLDSKARVEAAWDAEIGRRLEQVDQGEAELLDWNAVKAEVGQALKRR